MAHHPLTPLSCRTPATWPHHLPSCPAAPGSFLAAGNYSFAASAWNSIGESALSPESARTTVGFSTHPRFWKVQGSPEGALLRVIRPDSVAEPDNLRFKIGILKAGDSGSGVFRAATLEEFSGNGSLASPAVFTIPLSAFGEGTQFAQVGCMTCGWGDVHSRAQSSTQRLPSSGLNSGACASCCPDIATHVRGFPTLAGPLRGICRQRHRRL